jgi:hypothetical protein
MTSFTNWCGQLQSDRSYIAPSTTEHLGRVVSIYVARSEDVVSSLGPESRYTNSDISRLSYFVQANVRHYIKIRHCRAFLQLFRFICHYLPWL